MRLGKADTELRMKALGRINIAKWMAGDSWEPSRGNTCYLMLLLCPFSVLQQEEARQIQGTEGRPQWLRVHTFGRQVLCDLF